MIGGLAIGDWLSLGFWLLAMFGAGVWAGAIIGYSRGKRETCRRENRRLRLLGSENVMLKEQLAELSLRLSTKGNCDEPPVRRAAFLARRAE